MGKQSSALRGPSGKGLRKRRPQSPRINARHPAPSRGTNRLPGCALRWCIRVAAAQDGIGPVFQGPSFEGRSTLSLPVCVSLPGSELRQHQPCTAFGSEPGPQCLASPLGDVPCSVTQRQGWGRGGQVRLIESCLMGGEIQTPF